MQLSLNTLKEQDIPLVVKWHKDHAAINFPDSLYKPDLFRDALLEQMKISNGIIWVVSLDTIKIGVLWLKLVYDIYKELFYCDLHYIHLIKEYRGQGYGQELLRRADKWAKDKGAKEIRLGTSFDNKKAMRCYRNAGYKIKRVLMEKKYV